MQKTFTFVIAALLLVTSAGAKCPEPRPRLLCAEYFQSDVVVTARLLKIRHVTISDDDDYMLYTMQTERVLRGKIRAIFRIIDSTGSGRAGIPSDKGQRYLLFLSYMKDSRAWALDGCGNSDELEKSAETLKRIHELQAGGNSGTIQGNVWQDGGATVLVRGKQAALKAKTDKEGNFEIHVPAGVYDATVILEGRRFEPDIWSYEDPRRFRVRNGGCAQLQFLPIDDSQGKRLNRMTESPNEVSATKH